MQHTIEICGSQEGFFMQIDLSEIPIHLRQMLNSGMTLLWLEGAKTSVVCSATIHNSRLVLTFSNELESPDNRIFLVEKCCVTKVGLQFWCKGRAGVLYQWGNVPKMNENLTKQQLPIHLH
jgi:hypothetical protein